MSKALRGKKVVDKPDKEGRGVVWMMVSAMETFVKKSSSTIEHNRPTGIKPKSCTEVTNKDRRSRWDTA
jgi:hypothetical protein